MKRYNFGFFLSALFFNALTLCGVEEKNYMTIFTRDDLVRYCVVKKWGEKEEKMKDFFMHMVNPLLIKLSRRSLPIFSIERLSKMNMTKIAHIQLPEKSKVRGHWFVFKDGVPKAEESSSGKLSPDRPAPLTPYF